MAHPSHPYPDHIAPDSRIHPEPPPPPPGVKLTVPPVPTPMAKLAAEDFGPGVSPKPRFGRWLLGTTVGWAAFVGVLVFEAWLFYAVTWISMWVGDLIPIDWGISQPIGNILALILILIMLTATLLTMA